MAEQLCPSSLGELLESAKRLQGRKHYLAGGTDLGVQRRAGTLPEGHTLVIWGIPELARLGEDAGVLRIGAATPITTIAALPAVRRRLPLLIKAIELFASPQIRTMATLGGNICNGSPTADTVPPLLAMDAEVELASTDGTRRQPLASFYTGYKKNVLGDGEIVTAVRVRADSLAGYDVLYRKVGTRTAMTIAKLSVALAVRRVAGTAVIEDIRIAVGSLSEYPRRLGHVEELLRGADPRSVGERRITEAVGSEITPISDFRSDAAYRLKVCENLILGALGVPQSATPE